MNKKLEKYIQFAIDNNLIVSWEKITRFDFTTKHHGLFMFYKYPNETIDDFFDFNLIELITSKEFIEAVARGVAKKNLEIRTKYENDWVIYKWPSLVLWEDLIDYITSGQAIAIRDNKLEEFIINLLWE